MAMGNFAKNETGYLGKRSACKACEQPRKYEAVAMRLYRAALATIGRDSASMTWGRLLELERVPANSLSCYIGLAQQWQHQGEGLWELKFCDLKPAPNNEHESKAWTMAMMNPNNVMIRVKAHWP